MLPLQPRGFRCENSLSRCHVTLDRVFVFPQALADRIGVGCTLVRGDYGRAWNEVKLLTASPKAAIGGFSPPEVYIVDLMFHPGGLMKLGTKEADLYRFL